MKDVRTTNDRRQWKSKYCSVMTKPQTRNQRCQNDDRSRLKSKYCSVMTKPQTRNQRCQNDDRRRWKSKYCSVIKQSQELYLFYCYRKQLLYLCLILLFLQINPLKNGIFAKMLTIQIINQKLETFDLQLSQAFSICLSCMYVMEVCQKTLFICSYIIHQGLLHDQKGSL